MNNDLKLGGGRYSDVCLTQKDVTALRAGLSPAQIDGWFTRMWDCVCDFFSGGNRVETKRLVREYLGQLLTEQSSIEERIAAYLKLKTLAKENERKRFSFQPLSNAQAQLTIDGFVTVPMNESISAYDSCNQEAHKISLKTVNLSHQEDMFTKGAPNTDFKVVSTDESQSLRLIPDQEPSPAEKLNQLKTLLGDGILLHRCLLLTGPNLETCLTTQGSGNEAYRLPESMLNRNASHTVHRLGNDSALIQSKCELSLTASAINMRSDCQHQLFNLDHNKQTEEQRLCELGNHIEQLERQLVERQGLEGQCQQRIDDEKRLLTTFFANKETLLNGQAATKEALTENQKNSPVQRVGQGLAPSVPLLKETIALIEKGQSLKGQSAVDNLRVLEQTYKQLYDTLPAEALVIDALNQVQRHKNANELNLNEAKNCLALLNKISLTLVDLKAILRQLIDEACALEKYSQAKKTLIDQIAIVSVDKNANANELTSLMAELKKLESARPGAISSQNTCLITQLLGLSKILLESNQTLAPFHHRIGELKRNLRLEDKLKQQLCNLDDELEQTQAAIEAKEALIAQLSAEAQQLQAQIIGIEQQKKENETDITKSQQTLSDIAKERKEAENTLHLCQYKKINIESLSLVNLAETRVLSAQINATAADEQSLES